MSDNEKKVISIEQIIAEVAIKKLDCAFCDMQIRQHFSLIINEIYNKLLEYDEVDISIMSDEFSSIKRTPSVNDSKIKLDKRIIYYDESGVPKGSEDTFKVMFVRHKKGKKNNE